MKNNKKNIIHDLNLLFIIHFLDLIIKNLEYCIYRIGVIVFL